MDRTERERIYALLGKFYPNAKQLKDSATLTAYGLVLEKYTYEDVKAAVLGHVATSKFFPDISDLTANLAPITSEVAQKHKDHIMPRGNFVPCRLLHNHAWDDAVWKEKPMLSLFGMMLRYYCPDECTECERRKSPRGCGHYTTIAKERQKCPIMIHHKGEARQGELLWEYWQDFCPICPSPCFWYTGMTGEYR